MVTISLSIGSSNSKYAYSKLQRQSSEVLVVTWCSRLQRWWKAAILALMVFIIFVFIYNLYSVPLARHHQNQQHRQQQKKQNQRQSSLKSVLSTDRKLRNLASNDLHLPMEGFIHPNANLSEFNPRTAPFGPKMNSVVEMAKAIEVSIDIKRPCSKGVDGDDAKTNLLAVVFLFCVVGDFSRRQTIRDTYGSALKGSPQTELYFVLGRVEDDGLEAQLQNESLHHNDILYFGFNDNYYNLTLKALATLRWSSLHCNHAQFIFKLDSDAFIRLHPFLAEVVTFSTDTLYGQFRTAEPVLRDPFFKWAIDPRYWPYPVYPPYHAGPYLIPGALTAQLYGAVVSEPTIDTLPALPIDDAYITGVLAEKAQNISRASFPGLRLLWGEEKMQLIEVKESPLRKYSVFFETLNDDDLRRLWRVFGDG